MDEREMRRMLNFLRGFMEYDPILREGYRSAYDFAVGPTPVPKVDNPVVRSKHYEEPVDITLERRLD